MRGTPGFTGLRLREAREARGLTAVSLSDLVGVSRQAISQYEGGSQTPRAEVMDKIASALSLPLAFFCRQSKEQDEARIFFRSMTASTKMARTRASRRLLWLQDIVSYLREYVEFPPVNIPHFDLPDDPSRVSSEQIEDLALRTRRHFGMGDGPISNVVWLLENNGVIVARDELGAETLDAFSEFLVEDGTPYVILGSEKNVAVRSRFDAAHELGHLILHQRVGKNSLKRAECHKEVESQAHRFAGAFLLPQQAFSMDYYSANLDALRVLKTKWKVSIAMMIRRAQDLDFMTQDQAKSLWVSYSRRKWRGFEPFDDEYEVEHPRLLVRAFDLIIKNQVQTKEDVLSRLPYDPHDIEMLSALSGQLTDAIAKEPSINLIQFPGRKS